MIVCSPQLGLSPESNLGGEVHDREMIKALDGLGVETLIILPFGKKYPPLKHAKIFFLPMPFVYPSWIFNILILPYLAFLYWRYHFDVLRVHSPHFVGFGALLFKAIVPKVKIIATFHHLEEESKGLDRFLARRFDKVTTVSQATRDDLGTGVVIPNGVDEKYKPCPKNPQLIKQFHLENKKVLLYLGQLIERKNIPFLFKIIKNLPPEYVLLICGDGPLLRKLEASAPANTIFMGRIREEDKVVFYNIADVFVYPSLREGFGMGVLEALKCGLVVLANNLPAYEEYKSVGNLYLLDLDAKNWVRYITKLPAKKNKPNVTGFNWRSSAKQWLRVAIRK